MRPNSAKTSSNKSKAKPASQLSSGQSTPGRTPQSSRRPSVTVQTMALQTVVRPPIVTRPASAKPRLQATRPGSARSRIVKARMRPASARFGYDQPVTSPQAMRKRYEKHMSPQRDSSPYEHGSRPSSPAPDVTYIDRHWRCFNAAHMHAKLQREIPSKICEMCREQPPSDVVSLEIDQEMRRRLEAEQRPSQFKIYTSQLRPKSAPAAARVSAQ